MAELTHQLHSTYWPWPSMAGAIFLFSPTNAHLSSTLVVIRGYGAGAFDMSWLSKLCFAGTVLACVVTWVGDPAISVSLRQEQQTECNDLALIVVGDASHLRSLNDAQEGLNLRRLSWQSCMEDAQGSLEMTTSDTLVD